MTDHTGHHHAQPINPKRGPVRPDPEALMRSALRQAFNGRPVFPCVPDGKRPLTRHGLHDASTDVYQIRDWWTRHPTANIGMRTGKGSFDVLDVDIRTNGSGMPAYDKLTHSGLTAGHSHIVRTPSGGIHVYFAGTDQGCGSLPNEHIDYRATGGYVLVGPSVVNGRTYTPEFVAGHPPRELDWRRVRQFLIPKPVDWDDLVFNKRHVQGIETLARWVAHLPEGQRNQGTFWAACRALEQGHTDLAPIVEAARKAGLPTAEATRTVRSAYRRCTQRPTIDQITQRRTPPPTPGRTVRRPRS